MALLKDYPEVDELARELSTYTGETAVQAAIVALRERLAREQTKRNRARSVKESLLRIGRECAALPVLDSRPPDEILGYNDQGIPI